MGAADSVSFASLFKLSYSNWKIAFRTVSESPLLAMIPHNAKGAKGSSQVVPLELGAGAATSNDLGIAQANALGTQDVNFTVPWPKLFTVAAFDNHAIEMARGEGAVVDMVQREIDSKSRHHLSVIARQLYGDGTGRIGTSRSTDSVTGSTIQLTNRYDATTSFQMGQSVVFAAPGATSPRTGTAQISKVDRNTGIITFTQAITGSVASFQPGDNLFTNGVFGVNNWFQGLSGYLPGRNLTSTPFMGLDRTQDPIELAGFTHDFSNTGYSYEESIVNAVVDISLNGGHPDFVFMHPIDWKSLQSSLSSQAYSEQKSFEKGGVQYGFPSIKIVCGNAMVTAIADFACPQGEAFVVTLDSLDFLTNGDIGKFVTWGTDSGGELLRVRDQLDWSEARMCTRGNLIVKTPRYNSHLYFPQAAS